MIDCNSRGSTCARYGAVDRRQQREMTNNNNTPQSSTSQTMGQQQNNKEAEEEEEGTSFCCFLSLILVVPLFSRPLILPALMAALHACFLLLFSPVRIGYKQLPAVVISPWINDSEPFNRRLLLDRRNQMCAPDQLLFQSINNNSIY